MSTISRRKFFHKTAPAPPWNNRGVGLGAIRGIDVRPTTIGRDSLAPSSSRRRRFNHRALLAGGLRQFRIR